MFKKIFGRGSEGGGSSSGGAGGGGVKRSGQPSADATNRTINSIQQLADTEELLLKRRDLLDKKIATELQRAKEMSAAKNKRGALAALKKKKLLEGQRDALENNIARITEQQGMLEDQRIQITHLAAMRNATQASKQTMQELDIGSVDKVLDEINEQSDQMAQIQDAMAQPIGGAAQIDEDDLLAELEELDAQELDNQLLEPAPVPSSQVPSRVPAQAQGHASQALPNVPARRAPAAPQKTAEELELEQLEAEMAQ
jgi:hypothetical protein